MILKQILAVWYTSGSFIYSKEVYIRRSSNDSIIHDPNLKRELTSSPKACSTSQDCYDKGCSGLCHHSLCTHTTDHCKSCNKEKFHIELKTDTYPKELTWSLTEKQSESNTILSSGPYESSDTMFEVSKCIDRNMAYKFTILDSAKDGMSDGGYYKLFVNDQMIHEEYGPSSSFEHQDVILCTSDSDCYDGDPCTKDTCYTELKQCKFEYTTEFGSTCRTFGSPKTLALRIIAQDGATTTSASDLSNYIFGTGGKAFSMKSQFSSCSFNKFNIIPFEGNTLSGQAITAGVAEVTLADSVQGKSTSIVAEKVKAAALAKFGDLSQFDFIMFCLPPGTVIGTSGNWKAYAYIEGSISIYNDVHCNYPSVQMHEIGHNMGLSHSGDEDKIHYGDESGFMGMSYSKLDGPIKCLNGPKSWQTGWYKDSHVVIDLNTLSDNKNTYFELVGVADYTHRAGRPTMLKLIRCVDGFDYYIMFNRNIGFNSGTTKGENKIMISKRVAGEIFHDSLVMDRMAGMTGLTEQFYIINFDGKGKNILIEALVQETETPITALIFLSKQSFTCTKDKQCDDKNACTKDSCHDGACSHVPLPCSNCGAMLSVNVTTDDHPSHLQWNIYDTNKRKVIRSNGYYTHKNKLYFHEECLERGRYKFTISNSKNNTFSDSVECSLGISGMEIAQNEEELYFTICSSNEDCQDYNGCTIDECDLATKRCSYKERADQTCENCKLFELNIVPDNYPQETTWTLKDVYSQNLVLSGDPYPITADAKGRRSKPTRAGRRKAPTRYSAFQSLILQETESKKESIVEQQKQSQNMRSLASPEPMYYEICLEKGIMYNFVIKDAFGDGICCSEGNGLYEVTLNESMIKSGGEFGSSDEFTFMIASCSSDEQCNDYDSCTEDICNTAFSLCVYEKKPCAECGAMVKVAIQTDEDAPQNSWKISKLNSNTTIMDAGPFTNSFNKFEKSKCLSYGSYKYTFFDSNYDGMRNCNQRHCGYFVSINEAEVLKSDGLIENEYSEWFGVCVNDAQCNDGDECTSDSCDEVTKSCRFVKMECNECGKTRVAVDVYTDKSPQDTAWTIYKRKVSGTQSEDNELENFPFVKAYHHYHRDECFTEGTYTFEIEDNKQNGMLECDLGQKCGYMVTVGDVKVKESNGNFQNDESFEFVVTKPTTQNR